MTQNCPPGDRHLEEHLNLLTGFSSVQLPAIRCCPNSRQGPRSDLMFTTQSGGKLERNFGLPTTITGFQKLEQGFASLNRVVRFYIPKLHIMRKNAFGRSRPIVQPYCCGFIFTHYCNNIYSSIIGFPMSNFGCLRPDFHQWLCDD